MEKLTRDSISANVREHDEEEEKESEGACSIDSCAEMTEESDPSQIKISKANRKTEEDSKNLVGSSHPPGTPTLGTFSHSELLDMMKIGTVDLYNLEEFMDDDQRKDAIQIRREFLLNFKSHLVEAICRIPCQYQSPKTGNPIPRKLQPEGMIGFTFIPLAVTEKILVDGMGYYVPMATTHVTCDIDEDEDDQGENVIDDGTGSDSDNNNVNDPENDQPTPTPNSAKVPRIRDIIGHVNRGIRACVMGVDTHLFADSTKLSAIVEMPNARAAASVIDWFHIKTNFFKVKKAFESTSKILSLVDIKVNPFGKKCSLRFAATVGDSADPNLILKKGVEAALEIMGKSFYMMKTLYTSADFGYYKSHWKGMTADCFIPAEMVQTVLMTWSKAMVEQNQFKNAHGIGQNIATQVVTAIFVATGQDCTLIPRSSRCSVAMKQGGLDGEDLYVTVTMPSIQVGATGGATENPAQFAALELMQPEGPNLDFRGGNGLKLARIICGCVLLAQLSAIAELSLLRPVKPENTSFNPTVFGKATRKKLLRKFQKLQTESKNEPESE